MPLRESGPTRTAFRSPWQNGAAERWVGSVRRELLDHVVVFNERHLRRLLREYVAYYHDDRTDLGLGKATDPRRGRWSGGLEKPTSWRGRGSAACTTGTSGAMRRRPRATHGTPRPDAEDRSP
jgi:transposase InsO family protein